MPFWYVWPLKRKTALIIPAMSGILPGEVRNVGDSALITVGKLEFLQHRVGVERVTDPRAHASCPLASYPAPPERLLAKKQIPKGSKHYRVFAVRHLLHR